MQYCTQCGTQFKGRYCPQCGAPAGAGPAPETRAPSAPGLPSAIASLLCYAVPFIGPIVFLILEPYKRDSKIRFDAWQALFLQIAFAVAQAVVGILSDVSWELSGTLHGVLGLAYFGLVVYMVVKSLQNERVVLPYVGPLAEKQK